MWYSNYSCMQENHYLARSHGMIRNPVNPTATLTQSPITRFCKVLVHFLDGKQGCWRASLEEKSLAVSSNLQKSSTCVTSLLYFQSGHHRVVFCFCWSQCIVISTSSSIVTAALKSNIYKQKYSVSIMEIFIWNITSVSCTCFVHLHFSMCIFYLDIKKEKKRAVLVCMQNKK